MSSFALDPIAVANFIIFPWTELFDDFRKMNFMVELATSVLSCNFQMTGKYMGLQFICFL